MTFACTFAHAQTASAQPIAAQPVSPAAPAAAATKLPLKTRNVILVMSDGLRWQELFTGADERLMNKENGVDDAATLREAYWRETPEARREALMPFVWSTVAKTGQIYGNKFAGSDAHIVNPWRVSYPGYSEVFCGFVNEHLKDNRKVPNPDVTVFEWLHNKPAFAGKVAAFGGWELFPLIFNTERCGFPVDGGMGPITFGKTSEQIQWVNRTRAELPYRWRGAPFDHMVFRGALEWMKLNTPRVMFLGLGETDEWGHEGQYDEYLTAANRVDDYLRELWETIQTTPAYKDCTTVIVTCDHGRGGDNCPGVEGGELKQWRDHNSKVAGAEQIWIMAWGPDTPALGERKNIETVTQSQIAATIAAALGEDYPAEQPRAAKMIADVVGKLAEPTLKSTK